MPTGSIQKKPVRKRVENPPRYWTAARGIGTVLGPSKPSHRLVQCTRFRTSTSITTGNHHGPRHRYCLSGLRILDNFNGFRRTFQTIIQKRWVGFHHPNRSCRRRHLPHINWIVPRSLGAEPVRRIRSPDWTLGSRSLRCVVHGLVRGIGTSDAQPWKMVVRRRETLKIHAFRIDMRSSRLWTNQQCRTVGVSWSRLCQLFCRYYDGDDSIVHRDLLTFQKNKDMRLTTSLS